MLFQALRSLYDSGFLLAVEDNRVVDYWIVSDMWEGFDGSDLKSADFLSLVEDGMGSTIAQEIRETIENKEPSSLTYNQVRQNGITHYQIHVLFDSDSIYVLFENSTREFLQEKELAKTQSFLDNFILLNPYPVIIYDKNGFYLKSNDAHTKLHGDKPPPDYNVFNDPYGETIPWYKEAIDAVRRGEIYYCPEFWYNAHLSFPQLPDKYCCIKTVLLPIKDHEGNIELFVWIYEDLTERKFVEMKLERLRKELERRVTSRTLKLERFEKNYSKASRRAACFKKLFSHDIRDMFNTIRNAIEFCEENLLDQGERNEVLDYMESIKKQLDRGTRIVGNVQNLDDLEQSPASPEPLDILKILVDSIEFVKDTFRDKQVVTLIHNPIGMIYGLTNEVIADVFENILINAIQYNESDSVQVDIEISRVEVDGANFLQVEFKDNGVGIPDDQKDV
ncbi:MAG TPA: HAMP domain-containing sensor histidine kinase, partial [Candidatus Lokiarchaeia archaeon]|nr:HAMP domain-containing sensor histidine kinase [Candidatus Lokiarchaeia archaeon]